MLELISSGKSGLQKEFRIEIVNPEVELIEPKVRLEIRS